MPDDRAELIGLASNARLSAGDHQRAGRQFLTSATAADLYRCIARLADELAALREGTPDA